MTSGRHSNFEDYTKARLGSRQASGKVVKCPHCGRKGTQSLINGRTVITHTERWGTNPYLGFRTSEAVDYCVIQPDGTGKGFNRDKEQQP